MTEYYSENYFQHADHFTRIVQEQESHKKNRTLVNSKELEKFETKEINEDKNSYSDKDEKTSEDKTEARS